MKRKIFNINIGRKPKTKVIGITDSDWCTIYTSLNSELSAARARQKKPDAAPSEYMKGLMFAIKTLESNRPYEICKEAE